jgi:hypothetical protein
MCTVTAAPGSWGGQRPSLAPYFRVTEATSRVTARRRALMLTTLSNGCAKPPRRPKAGGVGLSDLLDALKRQLATASTHPYQVCTCHMCSSGSLLPELLGKPDENSFGAPDVAEPIRVFVLDHFADELRAAFAEPGERIVDVLHGEHDA